MSAEAGHTAIYIPGKLIINEIGDLGGHQGKIRQYPSYPLDVRATFLNGRTISPLVSVEKLLTQLPEEIRKLPSKTPGEVDDAINNFPLYVISPIAVQALVFHKILKPLTDSPENDEYCFDVNYPYYPIGVPEAVLRFEKENPLLYQTLIQAEMLVALADWEDERVEPGYRDFAKTIKRTLHSRATVNERYAQKKLPYQPRSVEQNFNNVLASVVNASFQAIETIFKEIDRELPESQQYQTPLRRRTILTR